MTFGVIRNLIINDTLTNITSIVIDSIKHIIMHDYGGRRINGTY